MKIIRRPLELRSQLYSREYGVDRSIGCHVSTIIAHVDKALGNSRYSNNKVTERMLETMASCGFAWEHVISRTEQLEDGLSLEAMRMEFVHRPELIFPGELFWCQQCDSVLQGGPAATDHCRSRKHNGIFFTVDGINVPRKRVAEFKFTWVSSSRTGVDHMDGIWKWPAQNMAYCWGTEYLGGELKAVFVVGDYKQSTYEPFPEAFEFDLDYSQRELDDHWSLLVNNARALELI